MRVAHVAIGVLFAVAFPQAQSKAIEVSMTDGSSRAAVIARTTTPNVTGTPWAAIPARPVEGRSSADCDQFRIRAWMEGSGVRVLVFAVNRRAKGADQETLLVNYLMAIGDSLDITQTEHYGARRVRLEAAAAPMP